MTDEERSAEERSALELELDTQHQPMTAYERSKRVVQKAHEWSEAAKLVLPLNELQRPDENQFGVPKAEVAKAIGVSAATPVHAEQHVAAVEEFPDLAEKSRRRVSMLPPRRCA